jgi:predicted DCC family thiol-disulfide oxidoreductase YuxK
MTESERTQISGHPILLYDGVCVLCNGIVRFLLSHDHHATFLFAPLQSPLAQELIAPIAPLTPPEALEGIILITAALTPTQRLYRRTDAIAHALQILSSNWSRLGALLTLIPRPLREFGYTIVARLRYRLFGRYAACPIPTPGQRSRILGVYE